ncbi:DUF2079 domain-containing protein [Streptomyces sp. H39-S7]|uniref:DUF2079 domain-containing protein n=1 Tax=Streptomyces sp. H39-S7 TaxID=3004357 RepID=UPI0022AF0E18|nr:DUF2079 domain-containing protein [Streptomyces sp. H39-S7]MCZ4125694.1 DUF2079 domain-containing protein [Streptomyces sp. H39-S7]
MIATTGTPPAIPMTAAPRARGHLRRHVRAVPAATTLGFASFALYALYALRHHARFDTGAYDLGIFGQGVRAYADLRPPTSQIRAATAGPGLQDVAFPLLGDHFHPVLATLAPFYGLFPHVETLLIAQAALAAWSVYVVTCSGGPWTGTAYALSWGIQNLIGFDFHEVAFALPLLALALAAYLDRRWTACAAWASALLLVKEDLGATVLVLGLLLLRRGPGPARRAALVLCVVGPAAAALSVLVLIPHFNPGGAYVYLGSHNATGTLAAGGTKALTVLMTLLPTLFLAARSPLLLLALPTLAWRLLSDNPSYWGLYFHYSAVLMPIVFFALIDAVVRGKAPSRLHGHVPLAVALTAAAIGALFPLARIVTPDFWTDTPRITAARQAVGLIPDGARVAAAQNLAPHLTDRATVFLFAPDITDIRRQPVDWIVSDTERPGIGTQPGPSEVSGFRQVFAAHGYVVLRRN